jgi:hypothetical protein
MEWEETQYSVIMISMIQINSFAEKETVSYRLQNGDQIIAHIFKLFVHIPLVCL